jgi:hypothetical protein
MRLIRGHLGRKPPGKDVKWKVNSRHRRKSRAKVKQKEEVVSRKIKIKERQIPGDARLQVDV